MRTAARIERVVDHDLTAGFTNARHSDRRPQSTGRLLLQPDEAAKEKSAADR
jgi:hypothetical protein